MQIFDMSNPKQYREGRKALKPRKRPKKRGRKKGLDLKQFRPITYFFTSVRKNSQNVKYLLRFPITTPITLSSEDSHLKPFEIVLYKNVDEFHGFFEDIFLCNDLDYIDGIEAVMDNVNLYKGAPTLHDMFIFEFTRIHTGHQNYSAFIRNLRFFNPFFFYNLLDTPQFLPSVQDFSRMYHSVPVEAFQEYFLYLLDELIELRLLSFKIMMWDCQFIHSNASDYKDKKTKSYSDLDAGLGRHNNKFLGVGYMASTLYLYCGNLIVPVFCMLFPANLNDKTIFYKTMKQYFKTSLPLPLVILGDAGAYSLKNLKFVANQNIIPMLNAPKNIKNQNVVELKDNVHINRDFVPANWTDDDLLKLYAVRTAIERIFSHNIQIYNARRFNIRGLKESTKHRFMILILDLLKTLTCYKTGRSDLFQTFTAFSTARSGYILEEIWKLFEKVGYNLLPIKRELNEN